MLNTNYIYRKSDNETVSYQLTNNAFHDMLKRIYGLSTIGQAFNRGLKVFKGEDMLESADGLIFPHYRDMKFKENITTEEFEHFITAYKASFKYAACGDFAVKLLIQDIASGFRDNHSLIKFYFGNGGTGKSSERALYENIINIDRLVFNTHKFDILVGEKNLDIVSALYVEFNEIPDVKDKGRFHEFINALKSYNEQGKVKTRGLFKDFVTIKTNIRFQCNTNNYNVAHQLLDGADDAIKRRFFVAERVKSEHINYLYEFCHDQSKCRGLKTYIREHPELYAEKINTNSLIKFYETNHEIYDYYIESNANDKFEDLKSAIAQVSRVEGKCTLKQEVVDIVVDLKAWYTAYKLEIGDQKLKFADFKNEVENYVKHVSNIYIGSSRTKNKYVLINDELKDAIGLGSQIEV
jgi:hypothetical protein